VTGTKYLMTGPVLPRCPQAVGYRLRDPDAEDRERIDGIIFGELVKGVVKEESRLYFNEVVTKLKQRGCSAVALDAPRSRCWWTRKTARCRRSTRRACSPAPRCGRQWRGTDD